MARIRESCEVVLQTPKFLEGGDRAEWLQGVRVVRLVNPQALQSMLHMRTRKGKRERLTVLGWEALRDLIRSVNHPWGPANMI